MAGPGLGSLIQVIGWHSFPDLPSPVGTADRPRAEPLVSRRITTASDPNRNWTSPRTDPWCALPKG